MAVAANTSRILYHDKFHGQGFTNENTLANALLTKADTINPVITHLAGRDDKKFPLTFLTEGQKGGTRTIEINDVQYDWPTFRRLRKADPVVSSTYVAGNTPGLAGTPIIVIMETNWIKEGHTVVGEDNSRCRVEHEPIRVGNNYQYTWINMNPDPTSFIDPAQLAVGKKWSMVGGAKVSESFSKGKSSNVVTPGKMKNQISIMRKSYIVGGNMNNKTVECQFNIGGTTTSYWMPFEEWQHMLDWKQVGEESCWEDQYNRLANGTIPLKDPDTGLPIPIGSGVIEQIPNSDTYSTLTANRLKTTVADVMYGATDTGNMEVVLYTGEGGFEEFDAAMKNEASGFSLVANSNVGDKFVGGAGNSHTLVYGAYFTSYKHVDGHVITLKKLPMLDHGGRAENSPKHPVSGKPLTSYEMYFVDQSVYDGERNVLMVTQKGRSMIRGFIKGMAPNPYSWTGNNEQIATDQDKFEVHFLATKGVCIRRNVHCFKLLPDVSALS